MLHRNACPVEDCTLREEGFSLSDQCAGPANKKEWKRCFKQIRDWAREWVQGTSIADAKKAKKQRRGR